MDPREWEETIQKIVDEASQHFKDMDNHRFLAKWRAKLEQEPTRLPPYKIDFIVREVRRRLGC